MWIHLSRHRTPATSFADIDSSIVPARAGLVADCPIAALVAVGVTLVTVGGTAVGVTSSSASGSSAVIAIPAPPAVVRSGIGPSATCAIAPAAIQTSASRNAAGIAGCNAATGRPATGKTGSRRASRRRAPKRRTPRRRPPEERAPEGRAADPGRRRRTLRECGGRKHAATDGGDGRQNEHGSTQHDGFLCRYSPNFRSRRHRLSGGPFEGLSGRLIGAIEHRAFPPRLPPAPNGTRSRLAAVSWASHMRPVTLSICNRSHVHASMLQRSGRSEYDPEIATHVAGTGSLLC